MKRELATPSNLLSIARALLVLPFALVMLLPAEPLRVWGALMILAAMVTDKLDGVLARKFHQETEWGRILDPLADKIGVAAVAVVLLILHDIPLWFVIALVARDMLIFAGGLVVKIRKGVVLPSNAVGKWTVGVIGGTLMLRMLGVAASVTDWLLAGSMVMLLVSFAMYSARYAKFMTSSGEPAPHGTP
jgi:CDP-diacylglycerol--glycerol-3-phosphate 3-phosphatidyltransferase